MDSLYIPKEKYNFSANIKKSSNIRRNLRMFLLGMSLPENPSLSVDAMTGTIHQSIAVTSVWSNVFMNSLIFWFISIR